MESSRRCIMVITPSFTTSQFGQYEVHHATDVMSSKLCKHIIPIFFGVTPCNDSTPLSCPPSPASLSSLSSLSGSQNDIAQISTCSSSQTSITSSSLSADSTPSNTSRPVKINFRFCPLLGQLIPVLKPLHTTRKQSDKVCNYTRFLKKLRLRMPKPPLQKMGSNLHQEMVTVSHTKNLVENEVVPVQTGAGADAGEIMQTIPRLYPMVPIINPASATSFYKEPQVRSSAASDPEQELYPVVSIINPASATIFHQEPKRSAVNDTSLASTWLGI